MATNTPILAARCKARWKAVRFYEKKCVESVPTGAAGESAPTIGEVRSQNLDGESAMRGLCWGSRITYSLVISGLRSESGTRVAYSQLPQDIRCSETAAESDAVSLPMWGLLALGWGVLVMGTKVPASSTRLGRLHRSLHRVGRGGTAERLGPAGGTGPIDRESRGRRGLRH